MSPLSFNTAACLALAGSTLLLAGCGGGANDGDTSATFAAIDATPDAALETAGFAKKAAAPTLRTASAATVPASVKRIAPAAPVVVAPSGSFTLQQRADAARLAATNSPYCKSQRPFYWEIGDKSGVKASGNGGAKTVAAPTATTLLNYASGSKWIFATYVVQKQQGVLSVSDIKQLNFTSGHTNLDTCIGSSTVASCLSEPGARGGHNGDHDPAADGRFYYNAGHMQVLADHVGLGNLRGAGVTAQLQAVLGNAIGFKYGPSLIAGGVSGTPGAYGEFLRNILGGKYAHMKTLLGSSAVCTHANSPECPSALYNPLNQSRPGGPNDVGNEASHYSLGHLVEDDPKNGDGAFASPGKASFYPWIDRSKTYYGVLATIDATTTTQTSKPAGGVWPANCGRTIRRAWTNPAAPV